MLTHLFIALVGVFSVAAAARWRWGLYLLIGIAMLQDPVRKLTPGAPSYLVLSTVPVWLGIMFGAWRQGELSLRDFRALFPAQWRLLALYALSLVVPALLSLTYGPGSWRFTLLGIFTQGSLLGGILVGLVFSQRPGDAVALLKFYCVVSAVMMTGVLLERLGIGVSSGLTGTRTLGAYWITYRMGDGLLMLSGFFRSPDVLGWHAATLVMFGVVLALNSSRWHRFGWVTLAGWGCVALMLCARRKMFSMIPVFAIAMCVLHIAQGHYRRVVRLLLTVGVMVGVGGYFYLRAGASNDVERFYASTLGELDERVQEHGFESVVGTFKQAGFFGYGLGMALQGAHNISGAKPRTWQESGPSMLAAELGAPGLAAFVLLLGGLLVGGFRALQNAVDSPEHAMLIGVAAAVVANIAAGIVSAQIFGDLFIGSFLPFLVGVVLSGMRLQRVGGGTDPNRGR